MSTDCGMQPTDVDGSTDWYLCNLDQMRQTSEAKHELWMATANAQPTPLYDVSNDTHVAGSPFVFETRPADTGPNFWQMLNEWVLSSWGILLLLAVVGVALFVGYQKRKDREAHVIELRRNLEGVGERNEVSQPHRN